MFQLEIRLIYYEIIEFLNNNYKTFIISYFLAQVNPFLNRLIIPFKILFGMYPLISSKELNTQAKLYANNLQNSIKLFLGAKYLNNLRGAHQHFKLDLKKTSETPEREILKGVGLSMQQVRAQNPRLFNHSFLRKYKVIYKIKDLSLAQQKIILDRLKRSLEGAILDSSNGEISSEWYNRMSVDQDQLGSTIPTGGGGD